jgi:eukaryotic translation initiation factor 2C
VLIAVAEACRELNIAPKITMLVVGKRHHTRLFPVNPGDADRSGNCPAGTVVDNVVTHPVEADFFLLSHGGLLGTSRPAHYNPVYDTNNFTYVQSRMCSGSSLISSRVLRPDDIQALTFALCHNYARATRSVSIPAPVYCSSRLRSPRRLLMYPVDADIVCSRAKNHYAPNQNLNFTETMTQTSGQAQAALKTFTDQFKPLHRNAVSTLELM